MKIVLSTILIVCFSLNGLSQKTYTARKGSRFFPGHLHVVISVDSNVVHYELFNHWYSWSYAQIRDIKVPINKLGSYNKQNDTLSIIVLENKVKLVDKRNKLNRKVKHQRLCASIENMRKISYANSIAEKYVDMAHFHLYKHDDLDLLEEEFKKLVDRNLAEEIKKRQANKD